MSLVTLPRQILVDVNGNPRVGAKANFYQAGTTTPITTYTTNAYAVAHANPVVSVSSGFFPAIYVNPAVNATYKIVVTDSSDVAIWTEDNIPALAMTQSEIGQTLYPRTAAEISASVTPSNYAYPPGDVRRYGAVGDGVTDDTAALARWGLVAAQGVECWLQPDTYLITYANAPTANADAFGRKVVYFSGVQDARIRGNGATIKCVNHNCSTGGLMFIWGTSSQRVLIDGLHFDMTFTGVNTSGSAYPFVGGIIFTDTATGAHTQTELCGDIVVRDMTFKLYHQYGQYAQSGSPYSGDPNNGYKVFAIFASGDNSATTYATQNRNVTVENITFKDGHNGYGVWVWAYNNISIHKVHAENWVGKYSNSAGTIQGGGVGMIRYHQFYNSGIEVTGCKFRAKPCSERTVSGFQGNAIFCALDTNLTGDLDHGASVVHGNVVTLGNGDSANSLLDYGVFAPLYGDIVVTSNEFDGITTTTNAYGGQYIIHNPESGGGNGKSSLLVDGNTFGVHGSYNDNIVLSNGSSTSDAQRRCKSLIVTNNVSMSQAQHFVDMDGNSSATYLGCRHTVIQGNTVIGTHNTVFNSASSNSRAFRLSANQSTDAIIVRDNIVKDKYYFAVATNLNASARALVTDNIWEGGTTEYLGGSLPSRDGYGASIASASTITLPYGGEVFPISGTTNITSITASRAGRRVTLIFADALTFTDGSNLVLAGNLVTTANDSITLVCDGTNWIETGRSVN